MAMPLSEEDRYEPAEEEIAGRILLPIPTKEMFLGG